MSKASKRKYQSVCTQLRLKYPKAFRAKNFRPLKIGIDRDVMNENSDMPSRMIRRFLQVYCSHVHYLDSITKKKKRIGLDGKSVDDVTPEAKQYALELLAHRELAKAEYELSTKAA